MNFETFDFHPSVAAGAAAADYKIPTPIQARAIPEVLSGHDVMGMAQTDTGKTAHLFCRYSIDSWNTSPAAFAP